MNNLPIARRLIDLGADIYQPGLQYDEMKPINQLGDPEDRAALELYANPTEKNWRRRKPFAIFLNSLKMLPISQEPRLRVLAVIGGLQRLIGSFL